MPPVVVRRTLDTMRPERAGLIAAAAELTLPVPTPIAGTLRGGISVSGRFVGDHVPARPFEWWRRGQYVRYTRTVAVPANTRPGRYELWAGLWRGSKRRPARSERVKVVEDRADVGAIEVVR